MDTMLKQEDLENVDQPVDIPGLLREADKALLANKPVVAHECIRLAIREVNILKGQIMKRLVVILLCVLFIAGCSQVQMSAEYEAKLRQTVTMAEVRDADCQAGDPNECRSNSRYVTKQLRLFLDALEGKVSE